MDEDKLRHPPTPCRPFNVGFHLAEDSPDLLQDIRAAWVLNCYFSIPKGPVALFSVCAVGSQAGRMLGDVLLPCA